MAAWHKHGHGECWDRHDVGSTAHVCTLPEKHKEPHACKCGEKWEA